MKKFWLALFLLFVWTGSVPASGFDNDSIRYATLKIGKNDNLAKIAGNDELRLKLLGIINRIDPLKVRTGQSVMIPADEENWKKVLKIYEDEFKASREEFAALPKAALMNLSEQLFYCYEYGRLIDIMPVSTGKKGHATPTGEFHVLQKDKDHFSSKYFIKGKRASMKWGVRFHGSLYWIHYQTLPGKPDSHGCVRLSEANARFFHNWSEIGMLIRIVSGL
ncbi:hypothetical protein A2303_03685 [Candidatus Falkowbacteria bacterium RIFOXYB2_FULL_47_14]|uniref:L,D-TPase catalytic domain-containing protein n=1 Tax=Candidatus Falkowbacteria bacterium RIFOXYA2_FULL_47_19 TaxID=1797994 RepID=A0A1F5SJ06_9BACT|nr:MAG: hypothetical protein A2227_03230 [Candidatus Falkowbacteria bacterium RIFOXYA2_FULL_47_19]OGF34664.1 MAG: hypothetical protein A2468_07465 [Candidatus Falkowbacteria bacterium RIFOXYC2_FULL_46_15]OGF42497.1 MAG: hypothetical protein A2303_03685 [Candidatus Falkowbacteria bacterium RIFOXYB2_FULL_47_14]